MGVINREGALYMATGIDNSGVYKGRQEAVGIIKAMAKEITSFDVFGGIGISAGIAFASAAKDAYRFEKEFESSMREVASISDYVSERMEAVKKQILGFTTDGNIPVHANEMSKALYGIISAGHDGADGLHVLEVSAKAAVGGITETATAADAITTLLNAYKKEVGEAERVSDLLFTSVKLGKTTFGELGRSIANVAPVAAAYGVEMDQVLAAVATLTKQGTPTAQAMTQIRAAIVGVSKYLGDGAYNIMTFQEALDRVRKEAGGSEAKLRSMIPEMEAVNGVLGLTGINAKEAAGHLDEMNKSLGATEKALEVMSEDPTNKLKLATNNITALLRPLGIAIMQEVSNIADSVNKAFDSGELKEGLQALGDMIVIVSGAWIGYKGSVMSVTLAQKAQLVVSGLLRSARTAEAIDLIRNKGLYAAEAAMIARRTAAHVFLTRALKSQIVASLKATGATLTNPYVLAAAAVAALGYTLYKLYTHQTEASKAQERLNSSFSKMQSEVQIELLEVDRLFAKLKNAAKGTQEWEDARKDIMSKYGSYLEQLGSEKEALNDIAGAYDLIIQKIEETARKKALQRYVEEEGEKYTERVKETRKELHKNLNKAVKEGSITNLEKERIVQEIEKYIRTGKEINKEVESIIEKNFTTKITTGYSSSAFSGKFETVAENGIFNAVSRLKKAKEDYQSFVKDGESLFGFTSISEDKKILSAPFDYASASAEQLTSRIVALKSELELIDSPIADGIHSFLGKLGLNSDKSSVKDRIKKELESAQSYLKTSDKKINTTSLIEAEIKKLQEELSKAVIGSAEYKKIEGEIKMWQSRLPNGRKQIRQAEEEEKRLRVSIQQEIAQAEIDALEESEDKKEKQRLLNHQKAIQQIKWEKEDYIKKWKELGVGNPDTSMFDLHVEVKKASFDKNEKSIKRDNIEKEKQSWNEYLIRFGNFQEKKKAIADKYSLAIQKAQTKGEKETLKKELADQLDELDNNVKGSATLMGQLFADSSRKSISEIEKIIEKVQLLMKYIESKKDENGIALIDGKKYSRQDILNLGISDNALQNLEESAEKLDSLRGALDRLKGEVSGKSPILKFSMQVKEAWKNLKSGDPKRVTAGMEQMSVAIQEATPALSNFAKEMSRAFGGDDDLANKIESATSAMQSFGQVGMGVARVLSGDVYGGVMQALSALPGLISSLGDFLKPDDSQHKNLKQQYEKLISIWDELIAKKREYLNESYGKEAIRVSDEIINKLKETIRLQKELGNAYLDSGATKGVLGVFSKSSKGVEQREGLSDTAIKQLYSLQKEGGFNANSLINGRMEGLFDLSADKLKLIKEKASHFWADLHEETRKYLDAIISADDKIKDIEKVLSERTTSFSIDTLKDAYLDALLDMNKGSEEFSNNFERMLRKMVISATLGEDIKASAKRLHDKMSELYKNDEYYSKEDVEIIRKIREQEYEHLRKKAGEIDKAIGISEDLKSGVVGKLEAALTEGTAHELVGLWNMTALDIRFLKELAPEHFRCCDNIRVNVEEIMRIAEAIKLNTGKTADNTESLKDDLRGIKEELSEIRRNTKTYNGRG